MRWLLLFCYPLFQTKSTPILQVETLSLFHLERIFSEITQPDRLHYKCCTSPLKKPFHGVKTRAVTQRILRLILKQVTCASCCFDPNMRQGFRVERKENQNQSGGPCRSNLVDDGKAGLIFQPLQVFLLTWDSFAVPLRALPRRSESRGRKLALGLTLGHCSLGTQISRAVKKDANLTSLTKTVLYCVDQRQLLSFETGTQSILVLFRG